MALRWKTFEDQVRDIAGHVYGAPCSPRRITGSDIDGVLERSAKEFVLVEATVNHTLSKVRSDVVKLENVRNALYKDGILARCVVVLDGTPTDAMRKAGADNHVDVIGHSEFAAEFIEYELYRAARKAYPFGSAVDPRSGEVDKTKYVPVVYEDRKTGKSYTSKDIASRLMSGQHIVLVGEYGSGKSRCVSEVFDQVSQEWGASFRFPLAINLRECWGLERADEMIGRHFDKLGLNDSMKRSGVRAFNRKAAILLLDGFDEIGTQSWSVDESKAKQLRVQALSGVQDGVRNSGNGAFITGREHYFSSDDEMLRTLGFEKQSVLVLHVKEEFSMDELLQYFEAFHIDVTLPDWLPRRPLICQTISQLTETERQQMLGFGNNEPEFWNHFIQIICQRDARINQSFEADTIYQVFIKLAELTRTKEANVGPINQRELQEAFEGVTGALPVENASVMLQRLPSLGRVSPDSSDRQFIDDYILDGLRAHGLIHLASADEDFKKRHLSIRWSNPLQPLGQRVLAFAAKDKPVGFMSLARRAAFSANRIVAGDIVGALLRASLKSFSFGGLKVNDAAISELDFDDTEISDLLVSESTIESVILPRSPPSGSKISGCLVRKVAGASSVAGLPDWVRDNHVEEFDSVRTMSRIREVGLEPAREFLIVTIKKTFFQPGTGRKEEALLRGFEAGKYNKVSRKVLSLLVSEDILSVFKGNEGSVYTPNRALTNRMKLMLDQLKSSQDAIWIAVGNI